MLRLPYLDRAIVPEAKIVNYLLNPRHSGGRAKARFLESFGFRVKDWQVLRDAVIAHAAANDVTASYQTRSPDMKSMAGCQRLMVAPQ